MPGSGRTIPWRRLLQPWIVMPLVALVAFGVWFVLRDGGGKSTATATFGDQVVAVTTGPLAKTVSAQGTVAAAQTDNLSFTSAGTVSAVQVAAGDTVHAGQVLATIDSAPLAAGVTEAEATVAQAQAQLSDDTASGASAAQLAADQTSLVSAQDQVTAAQQALDGAQLVATFDGTVAQVNLTVGEQLGSSGSGATTQTGSASGSGASAGGLGSRSTNSSGGSGSGGSSSTGAATSATPQVQVISAGSFTVTLNVDDTVIGDVAVGQSAQLALSTATSSTGRGGFGGGRGFGFGQATGGERGGDGSGTASTTTLPAVPAAGSGNAGAAGKVTEVSKVADASSGVASYPVTVAFTAPATTFHVGATVEATITYDSVADAVQVPARAVSVANGTATVTVRQAGRDEARTVTTGLSSNGMIQIVSGVKTGESVVVASFRGGGATGAGGAGFVGTRPGGTP